MSFPHEEPASDHPMLATLRRTHRWEELTGDVASVAAHVGRTALVGWATIHVRPAYGEPWDRAVHIGVLSGGRVLVEDTCIRGGGFEYRVYLLRPRERWRPLTLPVQ